MCRKKKDEIRMFKDLQKFINYQTRLSREKNRIYLPKKLTGSNEWRLD